MTITLPSDVLMYGVPLTAIVPFAGLIVSFFKSNKKTKIISLILVAIFILSGIGINAMGIKIALPVTPIITEMMSALNLEASALESFYFTLIFMALSGVVCMVLMLILTRKAASAVVSGFSVFLSSLPLAVLFSFLNLGPLPSALISSVFTVGFIITVSLLFENSIKIGNIYGFIMLAADALFVIIQLINNNFGSLFTSAFWSAPLSRETVGAFEFCLHQFGLALFGGALVSIVYLPVMYKFTGVKIRAIKRKPLPAAFDFVKTFFSAFLFSGIIGSLLMLIPVEIQNYTVTSLICYALGLAVTIVLNIAVMREMRAIMRDT
ncbi:MAG: hypothetical protein ACOYIQ_04535 [Christensenellales bacterium]|jgi:hypothetical protein